jgi:hypothetical protein
MATFYSAASDPQQSSLDSGNYVKAETRLVHHGSDAFTCATSCFAGARFHGFFKVTAGACTGIPVRSGTARTYFLGKSEVDGWATAAAGPVTVSCTVGQYLEIFQEVRKGSATSHAMVDLLLLDTASPTNFVSGNLYAAYAISNTPVPLTVTK